MPKHGSGIRWTQERRAEHAKATIAGRKRKRRVTPRALKHFSESGIVAEELRPIVKLRTMQYSRMLDDLGGIDEVSAMQQAALDGWLGVQVVADATLARLLENPRVDRLPATLATLTNSARANLLALGLERRVREVQMSTLEELVDVTPPNDEQPDSVPAVADDRRVASNLSARARAGESL